MAALDEQGRPIIHSEDTPNARNERERWVMVKGSGGPDTLVQEYVTTGAHGSGSSHVRRGMTLSADDFGTADLPHEVRHKLYKFLEEQKARGP